MRQCAYFAIAAWMLGIVRVHAAEIFYLDHDVLTLSYVGATGPLVLSGDIEPGDCARLLAKLRAETEHFLEQHKVIVAFTGGDVHEVLMIATLLKSLHATVNVDRLTGRCAGPCFLLFAGADERATDAADLVGVNRYDPSIPGDDAEVARFFADNQVPSVLVEQWWRHTPEHVYWLTEADQVLLKPRSAEFTLYLKNRCAWDDTLERNAIAGRRPLGDLKALWTCRARVLALETRAMLAVPRSAP